MDGRGGVRKRDIMKIAERSSIQRSWTIALLCRNDIALHVELLRDLGARRFGDVARRERAGAHAPQFALGGVHAVDVTVDALPAQAIAHLVRGSLVAIGRQLPRPGTG